MNEYLYSLIFICFCISAFSFVSYKEGCRGARLAFGILLCFAAAAPIAKALPSVSLDGIIGGIQGGAVGEHIYSENAEKAFEEGIAAAVCSEFSLDSSDVRVTVSGFDFKSMRADGISVFLSGRGVFANIEKIENYITSSGLGKCEVFIEL